jgi:two-component system nitrate/nitrite response regulator NarL
MVNILPVSPTQARVVVADRTAMNSQMLAEALVKDGRFEICGTVCTSSSILSAVNDTLPDVVVVSAQLEDGDSKGFEVTRELRTLGRDTRVIMLLDSSERSTVVDAFRAGAKGVFCRNQPLKLLSKCVHSVHSGQVWANSQELAFLLDMVSEMPAVVKRGGVSGLLSKREQDVAQGVTKGLTNREIAVDLGLTEHTVKNYMFRIFEKLGISTRVELVLHTLALVSPQADKAVSAPRKALPLTQSHSFPKKDTAPSLPEETPGKVFRVR